MAAPSDSGALSVAMASDGESVGSGLCVAASRSNTSVVSIVVSSSNVTDMAVDISLAASDISLADISLAASGSDSDVGASASGGLPRPGQELEVVSRGSPSTVSGVGRYVWRISPTCQRPVA